jgi:hypothetical protein
MSKIEQEKDNARKKLLPERAREAEGQWRAELGLNKRLHRKGNAARRERRQRRVSERTQGRGSISTLSQEAVRQAWASIKGTVH